MRRNARGSSGSSVCRAAPPVLRRNVRRGSGSSAARTSRSWIVRLFGVWHRCRPRMGYEGSVVQSAARGPLKRVYRGHVGLASPVSSGMRACGAEPVWRRHSGGQPRLRNPGPEPARGDPHPSPRTQRGNRRSPTASRPMPVRLSSPSHPLHNETSMRRPPRHFHIHPPVSRETRRA